MTRYVYIRCQLIPGGARVPLRESRSSFKSEVKFFSDFDTLYLQNYISPNPNELSWVELLRYERGFSVNFHVAYKVYVYTTVARDCLRRFH